MARNKSGSVSLSTIFTQYFKDHPEWLEPGAGNTAIYEQFEADHPNIGITKSVKNVCANIKSKLRNAAGIKGRLKGGRKAKVQSVTKVVNASKSAKGTLEMLEESIDTCLITAKATKDANLDDVIKYLRRARNFVSIRLDEIDG